MNSLYKKAKNSTLLGLHKEKNGRISFALTLESWNFKFRRRVSELERRDREGVVQLEKIRKIDRRRAVDGIEAETGNFVRQLCKRCEM